MCDDGTGGGGRGGRGGAGGGGGRGWGWGRGGGGRRRRGRVGKERRIGKEEINVNKIIGKFLNIEGKERRKEMRRKLLVKISFLFLFCNPCLMWLDNVKEMGEHEAKEEERRTWYKWRWFNSFILLPHAVKKNI